MCHCLKLHLTRDPTVIIIESNSAYKKKNESTTIQTKYSKMISKGSKFFGRQLDDTFILYCNKYFIN